jgi:uncharacterized YigZ family protein
MSSPGIIKTLKYSYENSYKEKGSEFIAAAFPAESEEKVNNFLSETKKKYYDASHHCYAYRLKDDSFRYSDAGEPNGTAGIRILNAIDHFEIKDILIIVTRYFGGIKLGIGPLGKAYYRSSEMLLEKCSFQEEKPYNKVEVKCSFDYLNLVHREISTYSGIIQNIDYGNDVTFKILIPAGNAASFGSDLINSSNGNIKIFADTEVIYHNI